MNKKCGQQVSDTVKERGGGSTRETAQWRQVSCGLSPINSDRHK